MKASYFKHVLKFKTPSGTSRGVLANKESWFIIITNENIYGIGECSLIPGLSPDPASKFELKLKEVCKNIHLGFDKLSEDLIKFPSILFGLETAFRSFYCENPFVFSKSKLTTGQDGISINGLIWMGDKSFMKRQIKNKINTGFNCLKIKIGSLDFASECDLLKFIRSEYSLSDLELRVDANGSFSNKSALKKLQKLSEYKIHSIEQPIQSNQWCEMASLCEKSPLPIALDEELIGVLSIEAQTKMLHEIKPAYVVLKPSLIGGLRKADSWIQSAEDLGIDWWATSALESNIGLNAISQWLYEKSSCLHQGLGTGMLYSNNIDSPYFIQNGCLKYNPKNPWETELFLNHIS
ncbi:uncharacterized protein METZ01_LOCUS32512 [marine metagenome]|uniref:Mandelate racemase/muconate lactonizing enzyme C-terminal domain-containing protein n=1 Tax=marine metagenome TaxID=408172 RepID=A0A381QLB0_9ZZZZ|tara:strand:- start:3351 stop:4403 length:1053 start_codon:yes stop_codon:yes gene_type:complete